MTTHLSARLTWHDSGWNGTVCRDPEANVYCSVHDHIRDRKNDELQMQFAGRKLNEIQFRPPCNRDPAAWSPQGYEIRHDDPLEWRNLAGAVEDLPPYSVSTSPYGHMFAERGGWEYDRDNQLEKLTTFWGELAPRRSLIFYYLKDGQPFVETSQRIVCGVGRILKLGPQLYFSGSYQGKEGYPIWSRAVVQNFPAEGLRVPVQEYFALGRDATSILNVIPQDLVESFSFVAEHVSDDSAVTVLERMIDVVRQIKEDGVVEGAWDRHVAWLESVLAEVWSDRGPYPGIPAVLAYLNCATGATLLKEHLREQGPQAWSRLEAWLNGAFSEAPAAHMSGLIRASSAWKSSPDPRKDLLTLLARMDLTRDQVDRLVHPLKRAEAGIDVDDEALLANPYLVAELDMGTDDSKPISIETIDHALLPLAGIATIEPIANDDDRRVRAALNEVLRVAAQEGDTLLRLDQASASVEKRFGHERRCTPDPVRIEAVRSHYEQTLWLGDANRVPIVAARTLAEDEELIRSRVAKMISKTHDVEKLDWVALVDNVLRDAAQKASADEGAARTEKAEGLARAIGARCCIITGRAGTGKTTVARALLDGIDQVDGKTSVMLLAPTGKARIRLQGATQRDARTIHQLLAQNGWIRFGGDYSLKRTGGRQESADTILIDEASMVPTDLLAALFRAIEWNSVKRLILMGDANQLPPIGPGRPFADIIGWLDHDPERALRVIRLEHRGRYLDAASMALQLSDGYVTGSAPPDDDEVLARVARNDVGENADLEVHYWHDQHELDDLLQQRMSQLVLKGANRGDYAALDASFESQGRITPEAWQILSPVRRQPFGTDEINRRIQLDYRRAVVEKSRRREYFAGRRLAKPAGDQQIVWKDKVIQIKNERRQAWSESAKTPDKYYVANGEVGIVRWSEAKKSGDELSITFGTQPDLRFRYWASGGEERLELAYAITVHKSQGSDFDTVFLVLPQQAATLSRELLYTALTRFKKKLVLLIEKDVRPLQQFRKPMASATLQRNTNLFSLAMRPETVGVPHPENLIHRTAKNDLVRSKSEVIVADTLTRLGISYTYEEPLYAKDDRTDFRLPDFTVSYEGDIWYWEHLGMLSVPSYADAWHRKEAWYERQGWGSRVLTSQDGPDGSIDALAIENTARSRILGP